MPQQIAVAFALSAFAVSIASGLITGASASAILLRAVVVLLVASAIGRVLGHMALVALGEHLVATTANNPVPTPVRLAPMPGGTGEVEIIED